MGFSVSVSVSIHARYYSGTPVILSVLSRTEMHPPATMRTVPRYKDEEFLAAFGQAVRCARTRLGLSQAELSARAKPPLSEAQLGRIELGRIDLGLTLARRIATALRMPLQQLLAETDQELVQRAAGARLERPAPST